MTMGEEPVQKITFDEVLDFKFAAAYEAYSKLFDEASGPEDRKRLNYTISKLFNKEISFPRFYGDIKQFREDIGLGRRFGRVRIRGQRKKAYRREQQEKERIKRHK